MVLRNKKIKTKGYRSKGGKKYSLPILREEEIESHRRQSPPKGRAPASLRRQKENPEKVR